MFDFCTKIQAHPLYCTILYSSTLSSRCFLCCLARYSIRKSVHIISNLSLSTLKKKTMIGWVHKSHVLLGWYFVKQKSKHFRYSLLKKNDTSSDMPGHFEFSKSCFSCSQKKRLSDFQKKICSFYPIFKFIHWSSSGEIDIHFFSNWLLYCWPEGWFCDVVIESPQAFHFNFFSKWPLKAVIRDVLILNVPMWCDIFMRMHCSKCFTLYVLFVSLLQI